MIWHSKNFKLQEMNETKTEWNNLWIKGCIKKKKQKTKNNSNNNNARAYIDNIDEAIREYYRVLNMKTCTSWTLLIKFPPSIRKSKKWWAIICYSGERPSNMSSLQVP